MSPEEQRRLHTFEARVRQMLLLVDKLRADNRRLADTLAERDIEVELLKEEIEVRKHDYNTLKMARIIDVGDGDKAMVRQRINAMLREVDKCLNLVKS